MHMDMEYRLAGSFIDVDSDIISVGVITLVHLLLHVLEHHIHCFTLMIGQIEIGGDMTQITSTLRDKRQKGHFSPSCRGSLLK